MAKQLTTIGGKTLSVPAYYSGQNANGVPDHYETVENAKRLKACGQARSIHRGTAILIKGNPIRRDSHRQSTKTGWQVIGQTVYKKGRFGSGGPGFPHWGSVGKRERLGR